MRLGPTCLAKRMKYLYMLRLRLLASSMRMLTLVSMPSNTRGGAK